VSSNPIGLSLLFFLKRGGQTVIFSEKREQKATLEKPQRQQTRGAKKKVHGRARFQKHSLLSHQTTAEQRGLLFKNVKPLSLSLLSGKS